MNFVPPDGGRSQALLNCPSLTSIQNETITEACIMLICEWGEQHYFCLFVAEMSHDFLELSYFAFSRSDLLWEFEQTCRWCIRLQVWKMGVKICLPLSKCLDWHVKLKKENENKGNLFHTPVKAPKPSPSGEADLVMCCLWLFCHVLYRAVFKCSFQPSTDLNAINRTS